MRKRQNALVGSSYSFTPVNDLGLVSLEAPLTAWLASTAPRQRKASSGWMGLPPGRTTSTLPCQVGEEDVDVQNIDRDEIEISQPSKTSEGGNERNQSNYRLRGNSNQGEMERRAEERLLDERIRERYQQDIGDIFAK